MQTSSKRLSKAQRQNEIVAALGTAPSIRIQSLAATFGVGVETVRRDFDQLAHEGRINRTYGGAVPLQVPEAELSKRFNLMVKERQSIAVLAADFIADYDTLMLGGGASTWHVAKELARTKNHLTVVTHSVDIAAALAENTSHTVLFPPGHYSVEERQLYGSETVAYIANYSASKAILGASGVSSAGFSNAEMNAGIVYRAMAQHSAQVLVVADSSKFDISALFTYLQWSSNVTLITDKEPPETLRRAIEHGAANWLCPAST